MPDFNAPSTPANLASNVGGKVDGKRTHQNDWLLHVGISHVIMQADEDAKTDVLLVGWDAHLRPKSGVCPAGKPAVRALPFLPRMLRHMCSHVCGQMGVISSVDTCMASKISPS